LLPVVEVAQEQQQAVQVLVAAVAGGYLIMF
jgi:hypothetical protein